MPHPKFDNLLKRPTELKKTLYVLLQRIQVNSEVNRYIRGDLESPTGAASTPIGVGLTPSWATDMLANSEAL